MITRTREVTLDCVRVLSTVVIHERLEGKLTTEKSDSYVKVE